MPVSMHKLLIHSADMVTNFDLRIGFYTEEAQEARNKDNKYFRLNYTRKTSRETTLSDQFNCFTFKIKVRSLPNDAAKKAKFQNLTTVTEQINESNDVKKKTIKKSNSLQKLPNDVFDVENEENDVEENDSEIDKNELEMQLEMLIKNDDNKIIDLNENSNIYLDE
ncbi:unnamed protein product [Brachionus calyciflorus]|uniref:Uncharacterized protein n=1 Tax=Brachionus calyciflorus TaxID=104777 RepID=A0A814C785_9BILA|nr:unnamed protein product [Brachionus calyciflorus]